MKVIFSAWVAVFKTNFTKVTVCIKNFKFCLKFSDIAHFWNIQALFPV